MSGNTIRIITGLSMAFVVVFLLSLGKVHTLGLIVLVAILVLAEFFHVFFKVKIFDVSHLFSQILLIYLIIYSYKTGLVFSQVLIFAIFCNFCLGAILIVNPEISFTKMISLNRKKPYLSVIYFSLAPLSFVSILIEDHWAQHLFIICCIVFLMDTGAYFTGRKFGKHLLAPTISPKKTIEGLAGGVIVSTLTSTMVSYYLFRVFSFYLIIIYAIIALMSALGDLVQSKMKREVNIKDSSHLIPGHGGVYDRVDALYFAVPFYAVALKYIKLLGV